MCGACRTVGLASLMADLGVSMQAELRTDCSAVRVHCYEGARQVRHIHCPAPSPQPATATRKIRVGSQADAALSAGVGTDNNPTAGKFHRLVWRARTSPGILTQTSTASALACSTTVTMLHRRPGVQITASHVLVAFKTTGFTGGNSSPSGGYLHR